MAGSTGRRQGHGSALAWATILVLIGITQVMRGVVFDASLFFVVALLLVLDDVGALRVVLPRVRWFDPIVVAWVASCVGLLLVFAPRHGAVLGATMLLLGLAVLGVAWGPRPILPSAVARGHALGRAIAWWTAVVVATCLWELAAFIWGRGGEAATQAHPAISDLLDPALDSLPGRLLFFAAWGGLGVAMLKPILESSVEAAAPSTKRVSRGEATA